MVCYGEDKEEGTREEGETVGMVLTKASAKTLRSAFSLGAGAATTPVIAERAVIAGEKNMMMI